MRSRWPTRCDRDQGSRVIRCSNAGRRRSVALRGGPRPQRTLDEQSGRHLRVVRREERFLGSDAKPSGRRRRRLAGAGCPLARHPSPAVRTVEPELAVVRSRRAAPALVDMLKGPEHQGSRLVDALPGGGGESLRTVLLTVLLRERTHAE